MRRNFLAAAIAILPAMGLAHPAFAEMKTITDDLGRSVQINVPIKRAVVFNPYNAEFFRGVGGANVIVGIDQEPADIKGYWPNIGADAIAGVWNQPNFEKIVALKPEVFIMPRNYPWENAAEKLKPFNIPVVVVTGWDVPKLVSNISIVGELLAEQKRAAQLADFYTANMQMLRDRLKGVKQRTVYLEKIRPLFTSIPGSGWHDMVAEGGGLNIFADVEIAKQPAERGTVHEFSIDAERILTSNPDVIIKLSPGQYAPPEKAELETIAKSVAARPAWSTLKAAQQNEVHVVSFFAAGAVSKMIGSAYIAKALYPDRFTDIDPEALMRTWLTDFQSLPYLGKYSLSMNSR